MDDLISRKAAIDALRYAQHRFTVADEAGGMGTVKWSEDVIYFAAAERVLTELPSAQPELLDDGTLMMTVPHGMLEKVKRVMVDEVGTKFCKVMYQDEPERKKGEWIPTKIAKPPKAGQYLVTKQQKTGVCRIATAYYNPSFDEWSGNGNFTKVLAWQQLPTPYTQE